MREREGFWKQQSRNNLDWFHSIGEWVIRRKRSFLGPMVYHKAEPMPDENDRGLTEPILSLIVQTISRREKKLWQKKVLTRQEQEKNVQNHWCIFTQRKWEGKRRRNVNEKHVLIECKCNIGGKKERIVWSGRKIGIQMKIYSILLKNIFKRYLPIFTQYTKYETETVSRCLS